MRTKEKMDTKTKKAIIAWIVIADILVVAMLIGVICITVSADAIFNNPLVAVIYLLIGLVLSVGGYKGHNFIIDRLYHKKYISRMRYYEG